MQGISPNAAAGQAVPVGVAEAQEGKLFVFNLAKEVQDSDLRPLFQPFKPVYCNIALGKKGTSRRFAFALFHSQADARAAMAAVQGRMLMGRPLEVKWATAPEPEQGDASTPTWRKIAAEGNTIVALRRAAALYVPPHQRTPLPAASPSEATAAFYAGLHPQQQQEYQAPYTKLATLQPPPGLAPQSADSPLLSAWALDSQKQTINSRLVVEGSYAQQLQRSDLFSLPPSQHTTAQQQQQPPPGFGQPPPSARAWAQQPLQAPPPNPQASAAAPGQYQPQQPAPPTTRPAAAAPLSAQAYAAVNPWNLNLVLVTRDTMLELARVEALLGGSRPSSYDAGKSNIMGYNRLRNTAHSVLCGAFVRIRLNGAYTLRRINATEMLHGNIVLLLEGMVTPVLPEHVSSINPMLYANPPADVRHELDELHASQVYRGIRLTKQELAAVSWRLRAGEVWQEKHAGDAPAQRLAALATLVSKLDDPTEVDWRMRSVQTLDPKQELSAIKGAFQLPWAAATWMEEFGPVLTMRAAVQGAKPVHGALSQPLSTPSDASDDDLISAAVFPRAALQHPRPTLLRAAGISPDSCGFNTPFQGHALAQGSQPDPADDMASLAKALDEIWSHSSGSPGSGAASVSPAGADGLGADLASMAALQTNVWLAHAKAAENA